MLGSGLRFAAVAVVVGSLLACGGQPETVAPPPPEVTVATPEVRDVTVFQEFVGSTEAYQSVEIRARVQGYLDTMAFEPSSIVRKGQLLFVIEPEPYEAQRDRASANLKAAEAGLRRAESDLERLEHAQHGHAFAPDHLLVGKHLQGELVAQDVRGPLVVGERAAGVGGQRVERPVRRGFCSSMWVSPELL